MNATTVAVDLAKSAFQIAVADEHWRIVETRGGSQMFLRTRLRDSPWIGTGCLPD
jgi:hypothetical protein